LKGDFLFTVNPICLYGFVLTPTTAVYYHVERAIPIKRESQIPQWFAFILPTLLSTVTTYQTLSLLKLNYFSHFPSYFGDNYTVECFLLFDSNDEKGEMTFLSLSFFVWQSLSHNYLIGNFGAKL